MDHPRPWLRYVEADDLECRAGDFKLDGMEVDGADGQKLGKVNGFIVDSATGRPYYVAVDAGGWFKSKLFLVPIGHVAMNRGEKRLMAELTRDRVHNFPGFDPDEFQKLSETDLARMDEQIVAACCPSQTIDRAAPTTRFEQWPHYKSPDWWSADFYRPDRADTMMKDMAGSRKG